MVKRVNAEKEEAVEMFCKKYPQIPASAFTAFSLYMTDPLSRIMKLKNVSPEPTEKLPRQLLQYYPYGE